MKRIGLGILILVIGVFIWMQYAWEDVDRKAKQESEVTDGYRYQPNPRKIPQVPPEPKPIPPAKPRNRSRNRYRMHRLKRKKLRKLQGHDASFLLLSPLTQQLKHLEQKGRDPGGHQRANGNSS